MRSPRRCRRNRSPRSPASSARPRPTNGPAMWRRAKVAAGPAAERSSTLRSLKAISRADVAVLVIDAVEGLTAQDAHVAGYIVEEGKGLVIAVNKWDLVESKTDRTFDQYVEWIH